MILTIHIHMYMDMDISVSGSLIVKYDQVQVHKMCYNFHWYGSMKFYYPPI